MVVNIASGVSGAYIPFTDRQPCVAGPRLHHDEHEARSAANVLTAEGH